MEKSQEDCTAILYRTVVRCILNIPTFIIKLVLYAYVRDIFTEFQILIFCYY